MSGFSGIVVFDNKLKAKLKSFQFPQKTQGFFELQNEVNADDYIIRHYTNGKFLKDKVLIAEDEICFGFDGIKLQSGDFNINDSKADFITKITKTKGAFSALHYDQSAKELTLFADHTASRQLFYFWSKEFAAFSSSIFLLREILAHFNIKTSLSELASYMMLSLGYLLEDFTLVNEIKKIKAGEYISISNDKVTHYQYHNYYRETAFSKVNDELIEELDIRFRKSLELEYQKDLTYGYDHLATLSGGLDSRLNVMLAHEYGFENITALTFSEGFKSDELTARKISSDLALKHIVLLLNNGFQLYDIETPLRLNNCAVYYFGAAQTLAAVKQLSFKQYGLFHNGVLAESSKGGYLNAPYHQAPSLQRRYAVSDKLFSRIGDDLVKSILQSYPNDEMFVTYNRGFNAIHNGTWMTLPFTDTTYSYMDLEFADLAYSINPALRCEGRLTIDWMQKTHPLLMNYPWKYGINPTNDKSKIFVAKLAYKLKRKFLGTNDVPVPFDEWFKKDNNLRTFIDYQFAKSISWPYLSEPLKKDVKSLFEHGSVTEKFLSVSFLKSIELLFIRTNE